LRAKSQELKSDVYPLWNDLLNSSLRQERVGARRCVDGECLHKVEGQWGVGVRLRLCQWLRSGDGTNITPS
jgi:hypothetical protein